MHLVELTTTPDAALPLAAFEDHLRLARGFDPVPGEAGLRLGQLRAAIAQIEARISKALFERRFRVCLLQWRDEEAQALPMAPVGVIASLVLRDAGGAETVVAPSTWGLQADRDRPRLLARAGALPQIPAGGMAVIEFDAGFGLAWPDIPADLRQAVLLLATEFHEHRMAVDGAAGLPRAVAALIEGWRQVRVLAGRGARR